MTVCPANSSGADEQMAASRPFQGLAALLAQGIPTLFVFALPLSVAVFLFGVGKKLLMPESYWTDEVTKIEASISAKAKTHKACQQRGEEGRCFL